MAFESSYKILPAGPDDVDSFMKLSEKAWESNALTQARKAMLRSEKSRAEAKQKRREQALAWLLGERYGFQKAIFRPYYAKVVRAPGDSDNAQEEVVAFCGWHAPLDVESPAQTLDSKPEGDTELDLDHATAFAQRIDKVLMEKCEDLLGPESQTKYWYLCALGTLPECQGQGIGSRLVHWGIDLARKESVNSGGKIKGVWTIATPQGLRTYLKAGMKEIGSETFDIGKGMGENGYKFVFLVLMFDEHQ